MMPRRIASHSWSFMPLLRTVHSSFVFAAQQTTSIPFIYYMFIHIWYLAPGELTGLVWGTKVWPSIKPWARFALYTSMYMQCNWCLAQVTMVVGEEEKGAATLLLLHRTVSIHVNVCCGAVCVREMWSDEPVRLCIRLPTKWTAKAS